VDHQAVDVVVRVEAEVKKVGMEVLVYVVLTVVKRGVQVSSVVDL